MNRNAIYIRLVQNLSKWKNQTFFEGWGEVEKGSPLKHNSNSFCLRILCYAKLHLE